MMDERREVCEIKKRRAHSYEFISLRKFTRLLERYNKKYGTSFNYGRAVQALRDGLIDREKFINGRGGRI